MGSVGSAAAADTWLFSCGRDSEQKCVYLVAGLSAWWTYCETVGKLASAHTSSPFLHRQLCADKGLDLLLAESLSCSVCG